MVVKTSNIEVDATLNLKILNFMKRNIIIFIITHYTILYWFQFIISIQSSN